MPKRGGLKEGRRTWDPGLRGISLWLSGSVPTLWRGRNTQYGECSGTSGQPGIGEQEGTKATHSFTRCTCWDPSPPTRLQLPQSHDLRKSWFSQSSLNLTPSLDEPVHWVRVSLEKSHRNTAVLYRSLGCLPTLSGWQSRLTITMMPTLKSLKSVLWVGSSLSLPASGVISAHVCPRWCCLSKGKKG